jgi:FkbM family methyltransferase
MELERRSFPIAHPIIRFSRTIDVRGFRRFSAFLPKLLLPKPSKVGTHILKIDHGISMKIDPSKDSGVELALYETGTYEPGTLHVFQNFLNEGDCFIDIGANIGLMSIFASKLVGKTGKVISFEAHPETFKWLQFNIDLNKATNIQANGFALGKRNGSALIYDNWDINRGGASLVVKSAESESYPVEIKVLDDLLDENTIPKLIKIDVEGFELPVLQGAEKTIRKHQPILVVEYSPNRANHHKEFELFDFLEDLDMYDFYKLAGGKSRESSELIQITYRAMLPEHDNIVAIPRKK